MREVNLAAFETSAEAELVEALRDFDGPFVSMVAVDDNDEILGHIMFTPVFLDDDEEFSIYGLGPMSVIPKLQRKGIGTELVYAGLERCIDIDVEAVVVLGYPNSIQSLVLFQPQDTRLKANLMCRTSCLWSWSWPMAHSGRRPARSHTIRYSMFE